jgi:hypothetical protein
LTDAGLAEGSNNGGSTWTSYAPEWLIPGANAANYEVEAVIISGSLTSGPSGVGVWTSLAATQTWIRGGAGENIVVFDLSIRDAATMTVRATGRITLHKEA